ncbi:MAG: hypothetical protein ACK4TF_06325 [Thermodesulfovibrionales bacterium]
MRQMNKSALLQEIKTVFRLQIFQPFWGTLYRLSLNYSRLRALSSDLPFLLKIPQRFYRRAGMIFFTLFSVFIYSCTGQSLKLQEMPVQELRLEITRAMLVANGRLIEIRYRIYGDLKTRPLNPKETYIVDESTGEIFLIERPPRLIVGNRNIPASYIIFSNNKGLVKKDALITVVIGGLRQEHIKVEEQVMY